MSEGPCKPGNAIFDIQSQLVFWGTSLHSKVQKNRLDVADVLGFVCETKRKEWVCMLQLFFSFSKPHEQAHRPKKHRRLQETVSFAASQPGSLPPPLSSVSSLVPSQPAFPWHRALPVWGPLNGRLLSNDKSHQERNITYWQRKFTGVREFSRLNTVSYSNTWETGLLKLWKSFNWLEIQTHNTQHYLGMTAVLDRDTSNR